MKYNFPNYDESIINLVSSIAKNFGVNTGKQGLLCIDKILNEKNYKNVVLVLYDGFGYNLLKKSKDITPFLNAHLYTKISTVFPPTTTAATTSVITGLSPYEHGWLGWEMYFKSYNEVMTLYLNTIKDKKSAPKGWTKTFDLLPYESITKKISMVKGNNGVYVSPFGTVRYKDIYEMNEKIKDACNNDKRNYVYAYYEDPDYTMHDFGTDSVEAKEKFKLIDNSFEKLCNSMTDTLFIMIADHGHINVEYITLRDHEEVFNMLKNNTSIDSRACSFMVKDEYKEIFPNKIKEVLKDDFILLSKKEVMDRKIFGDGVENKYFYDAIGDYMAIAISDKAIRYDENTEKMKSTHAGITEDETFVPLVIVKK